MYQAVRVALTTSLRPCSKIVELVKTRVSELVGVGLIPASNENVTFLTAYKILYVILSHISEIVVAYPSNASYILKKNK